MVLNMGPQHPSTHGVLRLLLELDGETIISCVPDVGFLHTGIEKNMESKTYTKALVMTDRIDYLNNLGNNLAYCLAVEKLGNQIPETIFLADQARRLGAANSALTRTTYKSSSRKKTEAIENPV